MLKDLIFLIVISRTLLAVLAVGVLYLNIKQKVIFKIVNIGTIY